MKTVRDLDKLYWKDHQVDGITFCRWMHDSGYYGYDTGADNALATGLYLAAASYRFSMARNIPNLNKMLDTLRGIHLLTHITSKPGVLVRLAFPLEDSYKKIGYDRNNQDETNTWTRRRLEGTLYQNATRFYYTKTTRDQLTGIVYGLAIAWNAINAKWQITAPQAAKVENVRIVIKEIVDDLVSRLKETDWSLEDHTGFVGKTNANKPNTQLRYALLLLQSRINANEKPKQYRMRMKLFFRFVGLHTFYYGLTRNMYAFNLRYMIAHTLFMLGERDGAKSWLYRLSKFTKSEDNPFFVYIEKASELGVSDERLKRADYQYNRLIDVGGHNSFFAWQKEKEEARENGEYGRYGPNIDIILPHWMKKYYNIN